MRIANHLVIAASLLLAANASVLAEDPPKSGQGIVEVLQSPEILERPPTNEAQLFSIDLGSDDSLQHTLKVLDFTVALSTFNGLGIDVAPAEQPLRAQLKLPAKSGLIVTAVPQGSIGEKAGIKLHDVLIGVGDTLVGEPAKLAELLAASDGKAVKLYVVRGGEKLFVDVTPKKPDVARIQPVEWNHALLKNPTSTKAAGYLLGVGLDEADTTLRAHLGLATGEGLVVTDVVPASAAASAGVKAHDVLITLDGTRLTTVAAITAQIQEIKDREVELRLLRGGKEQTLQIAPRKSTAGTKTDDVHPHWNVKNCQHCHESARYMQLEPSVMLDAHRFLVDPHQFQGAGQHFHLVWPRNTATFQDATQSTTPQQQIATLQKQLAAMQETLVTLEAALQPKEPAQGEQESKEDAQE